jgi:triacylglycerol lipase
MDRWSWLWLVVASCLTVALILTVGWAALLRRRGVRSRGLERRAGPSGIELRTLDLSHERSRPDPVALNVAASNGAAPDIWLPDILPPDIPCPEIAPPEIAPSDAAAPPPRKYSRPSLVVLRRPKATRHPILLAHGYFGFDRIGVASLGQEYFRGVRPRLEALGYSVFVTRVSPAGGIALRAAQLARQIERLGTPVNIIAHSMGGLDARLAIARLGLAARVASLTTIGTPHHGTPLADMAARFGEWRTLRLLLSTIGVNIDGLYDVSTRRMRDFNRVIQDCPGVVYASVIGALNADALSAVHSLLSPGHAYLLRKAGPNDGVVPATSQRWGESIAQVEADHWAQIGWFGSFDVESFYVQLAEGLAARDL